MVVGLARGERPGTLALIGMAAAGAGVVLASREESAPHERAAARLSVGLALVAALGFGTFFVAINAAAQESPAWSLVPGRVASVAVLALAAAATADRGRGRPPRSGRRWPPWACWTRAPTGCSSSPAPGACSAPRRS